MNALPVSLTYAPTTDPDALGELAFGDEMSGIPLRQLGAQRLFEQWRTTEPAERLQIEGVRAARTSSVFFGHASERITGVDLEEVTAAIYARLAAAMKLAGFPHPLRVWHHVPTINREVEGLEQYRRFCIGRYNALEKLGYRLEDDLPAASAVGTHGDRLVVYCIGAKLPGVQVENPRQVSAYRYPADYGPRSPSFARATFKRWADGSEQLFVSGTASIIGHESKHENDLQGQLDETVRNLDAVFAEAGRKGARSTSLRDASAVKVYVRNPHDYERIRERFETFLDPAAAVVYVEADICRSELLLEIEAYAEAR